MTNFIYHHINPTFVRPKISKKKIYKSLYTKSQCTTTMYILLVSQKNENNDENCKHLSSLYSMFTPDAVNCKLQMLKGYSRIRPLAFLWLYSWRTRKFRKIQCKKYYDDICLSSFFYIVALFVYEFQLTVLQSQRYYYQQTESLLKEFIENTTTNDSGKKQGQNFGPL